MYNCLKFGTKLLSSIINFFWFCLRTDVILGITSDNSSRHHRDPLPVSFKHHLLPCPASCLFPITFASEHVGLPGWLRWWRICLQRRRCGFSPWVGKIPWRREWLPTPVFLPGESQGQRSLVGYSPRGWIRVRLTWATNTIISLHMRLMTLGASLASAISPVFSHLFKSQKIWSTEAIRKAGQFL